MQLMTDFWVFKTIFLMCDKRCKGYFCICWHIFDHFVDFKCRLQCINSFLYSFVNTILLNTFFKKIHQRQHASRFLLIFIKILKMFLKVKYCRVNEESNLSIANGTYNHVNDQKRGHVYVHVYINTTYCVSNTEEL
jgi:hypothetical protein